MKLQLSMITALLLSAHAMNASSRLFPNPPEIKVEPLSPILYPHGQSLDQPAFLFGVSYLGGSAGQIERRVGTSGVISTRTSSVPTSGSIISAPSTWMNGFELDFSGSTRGLGSNSFTLSYSFLTGNGTPTTTFSSSATPDILPSFAITNSTGATAIVSSVTSDYKMPSLQDGYLTYSRSILINPFLSVMIVTGFHGFGLKHKMDVAYTDVSTGVTDLNMKEVTYGAGPLVGFTSTKKINDGFALRGTFLASAPLSNHALTQSDSYTISGVTTYGYNTSSTNQLRQHFVGHLDLEAVFRSQFLNGPSLELILAWHVKQYINQSYLTAMSNNQNTPPSTVEVDTLRVGLTFIF